MIRLTRLRHEEPFFVNHDHIERVDTHVDTVVRLANGTEFLVIETADEIVRRVAEFRARVIALASVLQRSTFSESDDAGEATHVVAAHLLLDPPGPTGQAAQSGDWGVPVDDDSAIIEQFEIVHEDAPAAESDDGGADGDTAEVAAEAADGHEAAQP